MQRHSAERLYELHWMRHADRYIALVRDAVTKSPDDLELQELLHAMQAALVQSSRKLH